MTLDFPMTTPADEGAHTLFLLMELVSGTLGVARALVAGDRAIDLGGLDSDIGMLCARILDLPPELGRNFRARLFSMLGELDALAAALEQRR